MSSVAMNPSKPKRPALVQFVEFLLLQKFRESGIECLLVGSVAANAYGGEDPPKDLDVVVEYERQTWQRILALADDVDPQPGGVGTLQRDPISFPTQMHVGFGRGLDVLSGFQHASFSDLYTRSEIGCVKVEGMDDLELTVRLAALSDLVEAWRARGQPRDLELIRRIGRG